MKQELLHPPECHPRNFIRWYVRAPHSEKSLFVDFLQLRAIGHLVERRVETDGEKAGRHNVEGSLFRRAPRVFQDKEVNGAVVVQEAGSRLEKSDLGLHGGDYSMPGRSRQALKIPFGRRGQVCFGKAPGARGF